MSRKTAQCLIAVLVGVAVLVFAFGSVAHWHKDAAQDPQCQVCHFAHSIAIGLSHTPVLATPGVARRRSAAASVDPHLEFVSHSVSSRAPPASLFS